MSTFPTEFEYVLPRGYIDKDGNLHNKGRMRLATAADEISPLRDPRVQANPAYLVVVLLSRVITSLGTLELINTKVIEDLFSSDMAYLQDFYNRINLGGKRLISMSCPHCQKSFEAELENPGEL